MRAIMLFSIVIAGFTFFANAQETEAVEPTGSLKTRWAAEVDRNQPWPEYPRPQMVRNRWMNLNGLWQYAITPKNAIAPDEWNGEILVPFAVESQLSGVQKAVGPDEKLWYRRQFQIPVLDDERLLLHFGAVDWHATVWINGEKLGEHRGGYDAFHFDITEFLDGPGPQELIVAVTDPTDTGSQARGKQVLNPNGIWYTAVTGIWQTVWLEPVAPVSIESLEFSTDIEAETVTLNTSLRGETREGFGIDVEILEAGGIIAKGRGAPGESLTVQLPGAKLWTPDNPHLYEARVWLLDEGKLIDAVKSYFAMREIGLETDENGHERFTLNGEPIFMFGPLDQGWWPDGLYTAPTDEALRFDIEKTKELGFNMARKHVKVEPARWYYHCDQLGLIVWQDMPNAVPARSAEMDLWVGPTDSEDAERPEESAHQFETELRELIEEFSHFPSIVMWVPFNEGWGQYDTERITQLVKDLDPSRLVNNPSGWTDRGVGDVYDVHMYPGPGMERPGPGRAAVLGEFGGLGLPIEGHLWQPDRRNWGYRTYESLDELHGNYEEVVGNAYGMLGRGLAAAIYTQTTDVEGEVNGLMTYDRSVVKFEPETLQSIHAPFYETPPDIVEYAPASEFAPQSWRYTSGEPEEGWSSPGFDASEWDEGAAPFASTEDPYIPGGSEWDDDRIWLRRTFEADELADMLWLKHYHYADTVRVYLNGERLVDLDGQTSRHYGHTKIRMNEDALQMGENVLAVEVVNERGKRVIDLGLYGVKR